MLHTQPQPRSYYYSVLGIITMDYYTIYTMDYMYSAQQHVCLSIWIVGKTGG